MAVTKLNLVFQSDQILDSPRVKNKVVMKTADADKALNLTFSPPAGVDRNVNFPDPTADDSVIYANATQTITNKTIIGGSLPDQPQYAHLAGQAGGQTLQGGTAASQNLILESTAHATKGQVQVKDTLAMNPAKNITVSGGGEVTGLPNVPTVGSAATSKTYVDNQVSTGVPTSAKEVILTTGQLDSVSDGIAQGVAFHLTATATIGNTFIIKDGALTETWTFQAVAAAFQPAIGASASNSMTSLVARINLDSVKWSAALVSTLQAINSPSGEVVIVWAKIPTTPTTDRIFGVFSAGVSKYVDFGGSTDYRSSTVVNLPLVDPVSANFGFGRITAALIPSETHISRAEESIYLWNDNLGVWQPTAGSFALATSASGGGIVGQTTFDSDKGLQTTAGVTKVKVDATSVNYNGFGEVSVATATSAGGGATKGIVSADENYGLVIVAGVMRAQQLGYLNQGTYGNIVGPATVSGTTTYPTFGLGVNDFEELYTLASTSAGIGELDVAFQGRLTASHTIVDFVKINVLLLTGAPSMTLKIYFEGQALPVYTQVIVPTGTTTEYNINTTAFTQPTGLKRFFVVAEGHFTAISSFGVSTPFVKVE